jgi:hypothetical protein
MLSSLFFLGFLLRVKLLVLLSCPFPTPIEEALRR